MANALDKPNAIKWRGFISNAIVLVLLLQCVDGTPCPDECQCSIQGISFLVDCSGLELTRLPEFDPAMEINWLDLSDNQLSEFPSELARFSGLESLDLTNNRISRIEQNALLGFTSLKTLTLNRNAITNWLDIHPNELLRATNIYALHLSGNPLTSFSSTDERFLLVSSTLKYLDLSECKITKITGQYVIQGLPQLEFLHLAGNPIRSLSKLVSDSLLALDVSNCRLATLQPDLLSKLPALVSLNLAFNHRLALATSPEEFVTSQSLQKIDLSYCNMNEVELMGMPNLKHVILRRNLVRTLNKDTFANNEQIQVLDISSNPIIQIGSATFKHLRQLRDLDLSFNLIQRIERDTFKDNEKLTTINLSRNYLNRFSRIVSQSITSLNMSSCEITAVDSDALIGMQSLHKIDLSHNLIASFPDSLISDSVQSLDLRMNRISSVRNTTFMNLPELAVLRLSGNRLTTSFRRDFFEANTYLSEIWLGDNPWRCDCHDSDLLSFYQFIIERPPKIYDRNNLRCGSPESAYGSHWEIACFHEWFPNERPLGKAEKVWTIILVALFVFAGSLCMVMTVRRCVEGRKLTRRERQRQEFIEEQRDITRQTRMAMEQQAQLNAPDPRETRPPCYEDALLLPRLDGSFASLNELGLKKERKRNLTASIVITELDEEPPVMVRRNRCQSEETLPQRDTVAGRNRRSGRYREPSQVPNYFEDPEYANVAVRRLRLPTSPPPNRIPTPPPSLPSPKMSPPPPPLPPSVPPPQRPVHPLLADSTELHYHSTEILNIPAYGSRLSTVVSPVSSHSSSSAAEYDDLEDFTGARVSPYSRRKFKKAASSNTPSQESVAPVQVLPSDGAIVVIENHFGSRPTMTIKASSPSTGSNSDDEFIRLSESDLSQAGRGNTATSAIEATKQPAPKATTATVHSVQVHRYPHESDL